MNFRVKFRQLNEFISYLENKNNRTDMDINLIKFLKGKRIELINNELLAEVRAEKIKRQTKTN